LQSSFDQQEGEIDFDREVRKITGPVEEALRVGNNEAKQIIDTVEQRQSPFFSYNAFKSFLCFISGVGAGEEGGGELRALTRQPSSPSSLCSMCRSTTSLRPSSSTYPT